MNTDEGNNTNRKKNYIQKELYLTGLFESSPTIEELQRESPPVYNSTMDHEECVPWSSPVSLPIVDDQSDVHTASVGTSSDDQFNPTEYPDIEAFVNNSCGCDLADDEPCSWRFSVEHYVNLRA